MSVSILLPNKQKRYLLKHIKEIKSPNDEVLVFNAGMHQITDVLNRMIQKAKNDYIILIDPQGKNLDLELIKKTMPKLFYSDKITSIGFKKKDFKPIQKKHISHKTYQKDLISSIDPNICIPKTEKIFKWTKISIIIPFMYNGDRWPLFQSCIKNLYNIIKNDSDIELIIHETGPNKKLKSNWLKKYNIKYEFTKWLDVFHRAWSLNYAVKHISSGDMYVFMDADLIVDKQWIKSIKQCNSVAIGWSEMVNLNKIGTKKFLTGINTMVNSTDIERIRKPNSYAAAGGINIYPKEVFYEIKGWCEDYYGTYGGEDNSTFLKTQTFGYNTQILKAKVFHLHHEHTTYKHPKRFKIFNEHKNYTISDWKKYINKINKWGDSNYDIIEQEKKLKILWCKIDTSQRVANHYDDLLNALKNKCHVDVLVQSLQGLHPAIFQQKCLNKSMPRQTIVKNHLKYNNNYDFIICANIFAFNNEKWNNIHIPKAAILEDQHGDHNLAQVNDMIQDDWIVLHRYQLKKFHTDLHKHTKCIWFPHSVNIKTFRDYKQRKKYDILQTGALYKVYETRHFMKSNFQYDPRYKIIDRPKENDPNAFPVGKDYSKELNKAYLNICCGSIYEYPVMKYFEIPASNSVIFGDYFDELGDLGFEPYKNMLVIDRQNIQFQVKLLLENKKRLEKIAQNGYDLIHSKHTNEIRVNDLIKIIKENIHGNNIYNKI